MYINPITEVCGALHTEMAREGENMVMNAVRRVGINVDKEELIKALQYDRNQYTKGYEDGKNDVLDKIRTEVELIEHYATDNGYDSWSRTPEEIKREVLSIIDKHNAESKIKFERVEE